MSHTFGVPLFNANLHPALFQQNLPPQPTARTLDGKEFERQIPLDVSTPRPQFHLFQEHSRKHNWTQEAVRGNWDPNAESWEFFSRRNIQSLQNNLRSLVKKKTGYEIDDQNETELVIIMQAIYKQYGLNPNTRDPKVIAAEIKRLNLFVLQNAVPEVISEIEMYLTYLRDASQNPKLLARELNPNIHGTRSLRAPSDIIFALPEDD